MAALAATGLVSATTLMRADSRTARAAANRCDREEQDPGLIGDDAWVGPTFGMAIGWDPVRWTVGDRRNPGVANAIGREDKPVDCGFGQGGSDRLMLVNGMYETGVAMVESFDRGMWTLADLTESAQHPGWVVNIRVGTGSALLISEASDDSLAVLAVDADDPDHAVFWQATLPADDESVMHELTVHLWEPGAVYALHDLEGIEIDRLDWFSVVDLDTIRAVLDESYGV